MDHSLCIHRLLIPVEFPAGLAPGAGKGLSNEMLLAVDGSNRPVLRGSALAGCLRHAYARAHGLATDPLRPAPELARFFGSALGKERGHPSPLRVADCHLLLDKHKGPSLRTHNAIERHLGAPRQQGLFRIEALPPGTRTQIHLVLESEDAEARSFLAEIVGLFERGLVLGGHSARGIGRAVLGGEARLRTFDLGRPEERAAWLDESWHLRQITDTPVAATGEVLAGTENPRDLLVRLVLGIPRGQDLCIADGRGSECEAEPQAVRDARGVLRWRIPGSSLRGVLRGWITRLAARAGHRVRDSLERFQKNGPGKMDEFGWGYRSKEERKLVQDRLSAGNGALATAIDCPVERLFGSLFHASRIHFEDAFSQREADLSRDSQLRAHVSVDRISGGANDGFLFHHRALLPGVEFATVISLRDPQEEEVRWLVQALHAMELGLLRFGSSKSVGCLTLVGQVDAHGPFSDLFSVFNQGGRRD